MSQGNQTTSRAIPTTRKIIINDAAHMPQDYSTTPGGTIFSTTPGGTRIIYDRKFLLQCRTSPLARTPPTSLPDIPGVTSPVLAHPKQTSNTTNHSPQAQGTAEEDAQFEIDI
ncbi:eukaryotic translation initiation factor 4E-binding protein 1 [Osmerus eperlanus]|uniref:eukaryotic translation initiation factor 4E-binding protein 1 n=1 Tax=Osmerus eperlanus TaxID=29151 RepID=UPI002E119C28